MLIHFPLLSELLHSLQDHSRISCMISKISLKFTRLSRKRRLAFHTIVGTKVEFDMLMNQ